MSYRKQEKYREKEMKHAKFGFNSVKFMKNNKKNKKIQNRGMYEISIFITLSNSIFLNLKYDIGGGHIVFG